VIKELSK